MKIAIMTWFHFDNYGTVLQAAALTRVLRERGHEVDIIRYFPKEKVNILPDRSARKAMIKTIREQRKEKNNPSIVSARAGETFQAFREKHLTFTDYYSTMTDLESLNGKYDAFICGSDLIWLPRYFDPHYYLDFVKDTNMCIAYAPSLLDDMSADKTVLKQMGDLIRRFKHLSVREDSGRKVLSETYQIQTEEVADPVLLMSDEDWENFMAEDGEFPPAIEEEAVEETPAVTETEASEVSPAIAETEAAAAEAAESLTETLTQQADEVAEAEEMTESEEAAAETSEAEETAAEPTEAGAEVTEANGETAVDSESANENADAKAETAEAGAEVSEASTETSETDGEEVNTSTETVEPNITETSVQTAEETAAETAEEEPLRGTMIVCFQGKHFMYWEAADKLASRLRLKMQIIPVYQDDLKREGCIQEPVSPMHFVRLLKDADYICTDSYHATVLSVLFKKSFCCFERYTERTELQRNARIRHILDVVGLQSRIYDKEAPLENYLEEIDWIPVNFKMDALRLKSDKYLDESLAAVEAHVGRKKQAIRHVLDTYSLCTGCGACEAVCPDGAVNVSLGENGFLEAKVDESLCTNCGRCTLVCTMRENLFGRRIASGRLLSYSDEEPDMQRSSAAGGLSARLAAVLHAQGIAVAGCLYDEGQQKAMHTLVTPDQPAEELNRFKGNKYMQSDLQQLWAQLAEYEGPAALFGTPCQIAAMHNALRGRDNIFYIDGSCSGVPSAWLHKKYQKSMQQKRNLFHWRAPRADTFDRMLQLDECSMPACYECRWRDTSDADLRIGDMRQDFPGRRGSQDGNLVVCLTERGNELLNRLMTSGYWEGLKKEDIVSYVEAHQDANPIKPVFYDDLMRKLGDERTGMRKLVNEYVKPFEKRHSLELHGTMFYPVNGAGSEAFRLPEQAGDSQAEDMPVIRRRTDTLHSMQSVQDVEMPADSQTSDSDDM